MLFVTSCWIKTFKTAKLLRVIMKFIKTAQALYSIVEKKKYDNHQSV